MKSKIIKNIVFQINLYLLSVNKQPTVHLGVRGLLDILFRDGKEAPNVILEWGDNPYISDERLSKEENEEVSKILDSEMWDPVTELAESAVSNAAIYSNIKLD